MYRPIRTLVHFSAALTCPWLPLHCRVSSGLQNSKTSRPSAASTCRSVGRKLRAHHASVAAHSSSDSAVRRLSRRRSISVFVRHDGEAFKDSYAAHAAEEPGEHEPDRRGRSMKSRHEKRGDHEEHSDEQVFDPEAPHGICPSVFPHSGHTPL